MTGFARVRHASPAGEIVLSIKSVNHRGLDMHFHLPAEYDGYEGVIRNVLKDHVRRGHLQIHLAVNADGLPVPVEWNRALVRGFVEAFRDASKQLGLSGEPDLNVAFRLPGAFEAAPLDLNEEMQSSIAEAARRSVRVLNEFREREGAVIAAEMRTRCAEIREYASQMERIRTRATAAFQRRLKERLGELLRGVNVEPQRLAQEAAILADRSDIAEEITRLRTHAEQLEELLARGGEVGKKLDFLLQEMNRESNTILSKTGGLGEQGLTITELALASKAEIDKIREQSLNLE